MKLAMIVCSMAAAVAAASEEWSFEVEAGAPRVVSCKVGRDWPARMADRDVAAIGADGSTTPVPWTLDTTGDQPELVFLADGRHVVRGHARWPVASHLAGDYARGIGLHFEYPLLGCGGYCRRNGTYHHRQFHACLHFMFHFSVGQRRVHSRR